MPSMRLFGPVYYIACMVPYICGRLFQTQTSDNNSLIFCSCCCQCFTGLEFCISINASLIASARGQSREKSRKSRVCHSGMFMYYIAGTWGDKEAVPQSVNTL